MITHLVLAISKKLMEKSLCFPRLVQFKCYIYNLILHNKMIIDLYSEFNKNIYNSIPQLINLGRLIINNNFEREIS